MEHGVPLIQEVDVQKAVRLRHGLLVHRLEVDLGQQRRQLLQEAVLLELVAQAPAAKKLGVDPHGVADEPQLLRAHERRDLEVPPAHEEGVQGRVARPLVQVRGVREIVDDDQNLVEPLHAELLAGLRDLALLLDDAAQRRLVPVLEVDLLAVGVDLHGLLDVLLDGLPAVVDVHGGAEDVNPLEAAPVLLQDQADQRHRLSAL